MGDLPDVVFGFFQFHWEKLGYTPIILYRLTERGWSYEEINKALTIAIGPDYSDIKTTEWIKRLEEQGVKIPDDEVMSFVDFMDRIIFVILSTEGDAT